MNFSHSNKGIFLAICWGIFTLLVIYDYRNEINNFLRGWPFYMTPKFNFDRMSFAVFTISVGYPVVAQVIRYTIDDLDKLIPNINKRIEDDPPSSNDKSIYELRRTSIRNIKNHLQEVHAYSEFKCHIVLSFVLMLLSTCNNSLSNGSASVNLVLITNFFMLYFICALSIFLYLKIHNINKFLKNLNMEIASIHNEVNQTPGERILEKLTKGKR